jgi:hypothetical protein
MNRMWQVTSGKWQETDLCWTHLVTRHLSVGRSLGEGWSPVTPYA